MSSEGSKKTEKKKIWPFLRRFIAYSKPFHRTFALIVALNLVLTALAMIGPALLGSIADYAADCIDQGSAVDPRDVVLAAVALLAVYVSIMVLERIPGLAPQYRPVQRTSGIRLSLSGFRRQL